MIALLGASGYMGQAFADELRRRNRPFQAVARTDIDYYRYDLLLEFLRQTKPEFLINAAGYSGKPNVDACELAKADTLLGNTILPRTIAEACEIAKIPWGHISSGCIYSGAKVIEGDAGRVEKDLMQPAVRQLLDSQPERFRGFTETDPPNFSFRSPPCSFYSGCKALAEEAVVGIGETYQWRLRIPFDQFDNARNVLTKVQRYAKVYDNVNSLSHRGDFVNACLDLWERRAPFGIYNVTNPGHIRTRRIVEAIEHFLKPDRRFEFWQNDDDFYHFAQAPRSNCILDVSKLLATGIALRPVEEALEHALKNWQTESNRR
jgi:dTDP-4-dehydrorhamnose reductase